MIKSEISFIPQITYNIYLILSYIQIFEDT